MTAPNDKSKAPGHKAASASAAQIYTYPVAAQIVPLPGLRPCVSCGVYVGNLNLGGYDGRSALTGRLFCDLCADEIEGLRA